MQSWLMLTRPQKVTCLVSAVCVALRGSDTAAALGTSVAWAARLLLGCLLPPLRQWPSPRDLGLGLLCPQRRSQGSCSAWY